MNDFILEAKGVSRTYDEAGSPLVIFENISFQVRAGERIAIVGSSGSGKSTFLNVVGGLDRATQGDVIIMGEPVMHISEAKLASIRNQHIGFVYQFHHLLGEFSALENVAMPLLLAKQSVSDAQHRAKVLLDIVGLGERLDHKPAQLRGGERQRVAIARALANNPACVLMDEPTGNLDGDTAQDVEMLIDRLSKEMSTAFVIVTHDQAFAKRSDKVFRLRDKQLSLVEL